jgi:thioesterase domain-containing protein
MACRLAGAGRAAALVAILDATPEIPPAPDGSLPQDDADLLAELFAPALATSAAEIRALPAAARLAQLFARAAAAGTLPPGLDLAQAQRLLAVFQASQAAAQAYRPGPYAGRLLLIRPALTPERRVRETDLGWGRLAAAVEVQEVAGRHDDLIAPAHAAALAECLRRGMAEPE